MTYGDHKGNEPKFGSSEEALFWQNKQTKYWAGVAELVLEDGRVRDIAKLSQAPAPAQLAGFS